MSAIVIDEQRILTMNSEAYLEDSNALVLSTKNMKKYSSIVDIENDPNFKLGVTGAYRQVAATHFPHTTMIEGNIDDLALNKFDAYLWAGLQCYIWCLTKNNFTTSAYQGELGKKYFAYPLAENTQQFRNFLNEWMFLKQEQRFTHRQRQYWFLGKEYNPEAKRWSILRDVLHWVE